MIARRSLLLNWNCSTVAVMEYEVDVKRLRRDMIDYFGTAMSNDLPMTVVNLSDVERASVQELAEMAIKNGIDIRKYILR